MADEGGKEEFDSAGEAVGYISLEQATLLAMQTANAASGNCSRDLRRRRLWWS